MVDLVIYSSSLSKKNKPSASDSGLTKGACPKNKLNSSFERISAASDKIRSKKLRLELRVLQKDHLEKLKQRWDDTNDGAQAENIEQWLQTAPPPTTFLPCINQQALVTFFKTYFEPLFTILTKFWVLFYYKYL